MTDPQGLANLIGATLRSAEAAAGNNNLGQTLVDLGKLHGQLGQAFHVTNALLADAGRDPLEWDPIAGNDHAANRSGGEAQPLSGGGPKAAPAAE